MFSHFPGAVIFEITLGMLVSKEYKGKPIFRVAYYAPVVISIVAAVQVWLWILSPEKHGIINTILISLISLVFFAGPFIWIFLTSFKTSSDIIRFPPQLLPEHWITTNYVKMWQELNWIPMFINSIWITPVSVVLVVFVSMIGAFSFAKLRWPFRNFCFMFWAIIIPLAKAGIVTMTIYTTFMVWNQYVYPLIYLTEPGQFTLQLGLGLLQQRLPGQFGPLMAAATIVSIPTFVIYLIFQRKITSGIIERDYR
jgi:ABC-type glycerol-3-phosphate transport system permease component